MARVPRPVQAVCSVFLSCALLILLTVSASAQPVGPVTGVVVDDTGAVIARAHITISDARHTVLRPAVTDATGAFSVAGLPPGTYSVLVEIPPFASLVDTVIVPVSGLPAALRLVLAMPGFTDNVIVTARRAETLTAETPQKVEVIDRADIERSVAADMTDVLKKNSGVDVIQYSGALSGIGIRGFRPQFSGINKRSLLLVDGRPSGVTNLATLGLDDVERVEVLKGAASAVYGSSAMGGVVNIITRQSRGRVGGNVRLGAGSFGASEFAARAGGSLMRRVDFDVTGNAFDQRDDFRMGNGVVRPATSYKTFDGTLRLGVNLQGGWRVDGRVNGYRGRDIMTPGELASGLNSQGRKNLERASQDARVTGRLGAHDLSFTAYGAGESGHTFNVTSTNALDLPYLPYLSFENELDWAGMQARDTWNWSRLNSVVFGLDYEKVTSVSHSFARTGDETAPFSANANKRTAGVYVENTLRLRNGRTVLTLGGRIDRITSETLVTPLKTNFTPSESTFNVFNPSVGVKHELLKGLRAHFTAGRAFIPAEASQLTGFTTTTVSGRTQISQGNPDLKPERSTSFDIGAEWTSSATRLDVTAFRTVVRDRFITNVVVSNPPAPDPIVVSVANGLDAHISGLDMEAEHRLGRRVGVFGNATHYFNRKERLASGVEQDILNVARNTIRAGVDVDLGRISARVSARYVEGRKDSDFTLPGFPIVNYTNFTVVDASVSYRLARVHSIVLALNNVGDAYYYEKLGYPLPGASFRLSYRFGF